MEASLFQTFRLFQPSYGFGAGVHKAERVRLRDNAWVRSHAPRQHIRLTAILYALLAAVFAAAALSDRRWLLGIVFIVLVPIFVVMGVWESRSDKIASLMTARTGLLIIAFAIEAAAQHAWGLAIFFVGFAAILLLTV